MACLWSNPSALSVSQLVVRRKGRTAADAAPCAGYISLLRLWTEAAAALHRGLDYCAWDGRFHRSHAY